MELKTIKGTVTSWSLHNSDGNMYTYKNIVLSQDGNEVVLENPVTLSKTRDFLNVGDCVEIAYVASSHILPIRLFKELKIVYGVRTADNSVVDDAVEWSRLKLKYTMLYVFLSVFLFPVLPFTILRFYALYNMPGQKEFARFVASVWGEDKLVEKGKV
ncbi:hypothetical protein FUAX_06470 [Fulvitalea axinellae]|uniref:Uncharacterized protein n=1 Tax=Fulvitalea axinellae TaxID=1182444 RepID=A0AAU9DBN6_9BACT|nr:hypothetical protein FUAX_06470 [Fulvitalea axinellae]